MTTLALQNQTPNQLAAMLLLASLDAARERLRQPNPDLRTVAEQQRQSAELALRMLEGAR